MYYLYRYKAEINIRVPATSDGRHGNAGRQGRHDGKHTISENISWEFVSKRIASLESRQSKNVYKKLKKEKNRDHKTEDVK